MKVGDHFSSYEAFEKALNSYKNSVCNEYWVRDARTISNQRKRFPDTVENADDSLKYYNLRLACVKGGRPFKSRNEKSTRKCSTLKQGCPASIFVRLSPSKDTLLVTNINEDHNHNTSKSNFNSVTCKKAFTSRRKFKIMDDQGTIMAKLCSEVSTPIFHKRLNFIQNVIKLWTVGQDFALNNHFSKLFGDMDEDIVAVGLTKDEQKSEVGYSSMYIENAETVAIEDEQMSKAVEYDSIIIEETNAETIEYKVINAEIHESNSTTNEIKESRKVVDVIKKPTQLCENDCILYRPTGNEEVIEKIIEKQIAEGQVIQAEDIVECVIDISNKNDCEVPVYNILTNKNKSENLVIQSVPQHIEMSSRIRKRGRLKGLRNTNIGLKRTICKRTKAIITNIVRQEVRRIFKRSTS